MPYLSGLGDCRYFICSAFCLQTSINTQCFQFVRHTGRTETGEHTPEKRQLNRSGTRSSAERRRVSAPHSGPHLLILGSRLTPCAAPSSCWGAGLGATRAGPGGEQHRPQPRTPVSHMKGARLGACVQPAERCHSGGTAWALWVPAAPITWSFPPDKRRFAGVACNRLRAAGLAYLRVHLLTAPAQLFRIRAGLYSARGFNSSCVNCKALSRAETCYRLHLSAMEQTRCWL